jgi:uncharacterized protein (TIGR02246 family)
MATTPPDQEIQEIRSLAVRWIAAVSAGEIEQLGNLMTDDIVVIHGDGRLVSGKKAVMSDFARSLQELSVQQTVESDETVVAGEWAFDRATVHTIVQSRKSGNARHFDSRSVTILRKQGNGPWRVARTIGVVYCQS